MDWLGRRARAAGRLAMRAMAAVCSVRLWFLCRSFGIAIIATAIAVVVRLTLLGGLGSRHDYITFYPAVALAALSGGLPAGALASVLSAVIATFWIDPTPLATNSDGLGLLTFLLSCGLVTGVTEAMRRAEARAVAAKEEVMRSEAVRVSEARLSLFFEHTPVALAMFDRDMRYISASRRWLTNYGPGLTGRDLRGLSHYEVFPHIPDRWREVHRRALSGEVVRCDEDSVQRADGRLQWLRWEVRPWQDAAGQIGGIVVFSEDITERQRLEMEREKFVSLADHSVEFIGMCDADFNLFYVNPAGLQLVGLETLAAARGVKIQDFFFPEDQPFIGNEFFPKVLAEGHGEVEIRFRHFKTGDAIWMHYNVFNLLDAKGAATGWATVSRDITARRQAEMALRDREERLRAIFEASVDPIITIDEKGVIQSVNAATKRLLGYEPKEVIGRNITMLMPEPYWSEHDGYLKNYLTTRRPKIIGKGREVEALRKDGTRVAVELAVGEAAAEGPRMFVGLLRDITERKEAEMRQLKLLEQLQQSESEARAQNALFRSVFESAPEGIVLTDLDNAITMINPALTRIFGYLPGELLGVHSSIFFARREDWRPATPKEAVWPLLAPEVISLRRKNGEIFPGETIKAPYRGGNGELLGYMRIVRDVTREQMREEELRQHQRLEALGQLTGGIAHDFNNLLTVISGNLQLIEMKLQDDGPGRYLSEAKRAVEMGGRLSQRLMTFARQRRLAPVPTNLNDQVTGMLDLLHRTIGEHITITTRLSSGLWPTRVDPSEIENAVLNLAINARDAMPFGGELFIETANASIDAGGERASGGIPPGTYVTLSVSDTGTGMSREVLARAFQPFFTTKEPGKGTGLGLSSIYGFVKQSGGDVRIHSEVGRGTRVDIYLPKLEGSEQAGVTQEPARPAEGKGETLLVVEDDPDVRRLTAERLEALGYRVAEAGNGQSALEALQAGEAFDLVLSDVVMPGGLSGFDLARKIRELKPSQKILLTSGFAGQAPLSGKDEAIYGLLKLRKPYSQTELARTIRVALEEDDAASTPPAQPDRLAEKV